MSKKSSSKKQPKIHKIKAKAAIKKAPTKTKVVASKSAKKTTTKSINKKQKKNFLIKLIFPIIALIRYIKASWKELKKVRWPSRKETWQKALSVIIYSLIFIILVVTLDNLFNWLFKLMLGV